MLLQGNSSCKKRLLQKANERVSWSERKNAEKKRNRSLSKIKARASVTEGWREQGGKNEKALPSRDGGGLRFIKLAGQFHDNQASPCGHPGGPVFLARYNGTWAGQEAYMVELNPPGAYSMQTCPLRSRQ